MEVAEEEEVAAEDDAGVEVVEDDDPEIDLGDIKLKKSELKAGYMKDADYRRKTAEAAEVRRAAEAERAQVRQEREYHANQLDVLIHGLQSQLVGDQQALAQLAETDPAEWVKQNSAFQQRYAQYQQAIQERQTLANRMTAEQEREVNDWRQEQRKLLQEKLPEWRDTKKAEAEQRIVAEYLLKEGYEANEIGELFDHRALIVARKAALYDQLQAAKAKQTQTPPKPVKPGVAQSAKPQNSAYQEALAQARKSGRPEDIERAIRLKGKQ